MAQANRAFLGRAVRFLAAQGIRQFLDIGPGSRAPAGPGRSRTPWRRARTWSAWTTTRSCWRTRGRCWCARTSRPTTVIQADLRRPEEILNHPEVRAALDFDRPIALMLVAVLHFVTDDEDPRGILARLLKELPSGSYLTVSHVTADFDSERARAAAAAYDKATAPIVLRPRAAVAGFFDGLDLVEPGVAHLPWWRPDGELPADADDIWMYGALGRKG